MTIQRHMGWALALATILGAMVLAGCVEKVEDTSGSAATSPAATASGDGEADYRVGVTLLNRVHNFYSVLEETMVAEAEARGIELIVQDGDFDSSKQKNQIEDFIV
ncbi:MAG: hypothetical protein GF320_05870, partial [Armatimonadia bacterium]|nr:hypothetical protein [Armatimonadia bacterium]